jgi:hypothetical protein
MASDLVAEQDVRQKKLSGDDRAYMPEAQRNKDRKKIFCGNVGVAGNQCAPADGLLRPE